MAASAQPNNYEHQSAPVCGDEVVQISARLEHPCLPAWHRSRDVCRDDLRTTAWLRGDIEIAAAVAFAKRAVDCIASAVFLVCLAPLFLLIAIALKADSPGPTFFRHDRVGKNGRRFRIWKFRSMRVECSPYARSPVSDSDPRLTRVGRMLRRFSLDELPQLINVLAGDMSLVGPRPEMPFVVAHYGPVERRRLCVKPGITGLWQISPARAMPIHHNIGYDLYYIENHTLLLDFAIVVGTIKAVIRGIGAV
jgi:lipopolysaccharide/colanic/teichoic acid biosynthesis glycosyltransferase